MPQRLSIIWQIIGILMVAILWNSLDAPFVYDDKIEVIGNPTIRDIDEWQAIISYNRARALLQLSYALNYAQAALEPRIYHITNLLIHFFSIGAALWMSFRMAVLSKHHSPLWLASATTTLWALHPMITESVIYTTGRSESLCALFCFLALGAWSIALDTKNLWWRLAGLFFCLCAMLSKEVGVVLPLIFAVMDARWNRQSTRKLLLPIYGLMFVFILYAVAVRYWAVNQALLLIHETVSVPMVLERLIPQEVPRPISVRLTTQAEVWLRYMGLWLVPLKQTIYHHVPDSTPFSTRGILGIIGWASVIGGMWHFSKNKPLSRMALVMMALLLLPSSSLASLKENMAEHRSHQMGFFFILYGLSFLPPLSKHRQFGAAILLVPLSFLTFLRAQIWQSEVELWKEATVRNPEVGEAWYGLGDAHRFADDFEPAIAAFQRCVQLDPNYLDGWNNLGITFAETGQFDKAETAWKALLTREPKNCKAHNNLGSLAFQQQEWTVSQGEFLSTLQHCPDNVIAHYSLGNLYYGPLKNEKLAAHHYQMTLNLNPTFVYAAQTRKRLLELTW